jgi:uncharacterized membrane protein YccC
MSISAAIGTLANAQIMLETISIGVWSFALAVAMVIAQPLGWLVLQCTIALIVAAAFPSDLLHAAYRALLLAAGGILQTGMIAGLALLLPGLLPPEADQSAPSTSLRLRVLLSEAAAIMARRVNGLAFAVGLTIAATMGNTAARLLDLPNGYWVPMTVVLIMRPVARETASRAVARLTGTVIGAGMITLLMALLRPSTMVVTALICLAAWGCFGLQRVNYMALSFCVTAYVASLFAYDGLPEPVVALHRTLATALGGGLALLVHGAGQWIAAYTGRSPTPSRQAP